MTTTLFLSRTQIILAPVIVLLAAVTAAQTTKQLTYTVGPRANISITNHYGSITVKPSGTRQVIVRTTSRTDGVSFLNEQRGKRIELRTESSRIGMGLADYIVLVPSDAFVTLRSSDGILRLQGVRGDVILESATGAIEATDLSNAYLYVKTLSGTVLLANIRNSHLNVRSIKGNVNLRNVTCSSVEVHSGTGRIAYEGEPGRMGQYLLTSQPGDLEISIPASAAADIRSRSEKGQSDSDLAGSRGASSLRQGNLLLRGGTNSASSFVLRSFKGNIQVKRP
jgi:DUF4097 and DUF4098 domain-containing protein YvlB